MRYESELRFMRDVFEKQRVRTALTSPTALPEEMLSLGSDTELGRLSLDRGLPMRLPSELAPDTVYTLCDALGLSFTFLLLPSETPSVLLIGPYHAEPPSQMRLLELGEANGISPKHLRYFEEYMLSIPVLAADHPLFVMLNRFCELIFKSPAFSVVDVGREEPLPPSPIAETLGEDHFDDVLVNVKALEMRYGFENELMRAVSLGQLHAEGRLLAAFSEQGLERRVPDALRNAKNYAIIMNTLLRKAAESGGVHPVYLDRVSSELALKIEQMKALSENGELMREMFRAYCRLVRKHSIRHLSPAVQKTVLLINSDLSANLTPGRLAEQEGVSLGYLSTIFKREMGKTVSEYIRERRMKHAAHLLSKTSLQIQTVALHSGIVDVQYFSKLFKREYGKTPREYRESARREPSV